MTRETAAFVLFVGADPSLLRFPANIDRFAAPLGAAAACPNRLVGDFDEDGVRVDRRQDANGDSV